MTTHGAVSTTPAGRTTPPVTQLSIVSLALLLIGGIYMVGSFPQEPVYAVPIGLLAASAALWSASILLLTRQAGFAWTVFLRVARWAVLAYATIAAMIEFSFIHNNVHGARLVILTLMLVMFALDVPLSIGFTVARFATPAR
jgi:hypothetical protein